jgi:flavin-binding protein dodecin
VTPLPNRWPRPDHGGVSVQKAIDLTGSGETIQDAVAEALDRARLSLEGITSFEVQRISGVVDESSTTYQVELKVWFTLLERMHG